MKTKAEHTKGPDLEQCEGFERRGGIMTLSPVVWSRCKRAPTHVVIFRRKSEKDCAACVECLNKLKKHNTQGAYKVLTVKEYRKVRAAIRKARGEG